MTAEKALKKSSPFRLGRGDRLGASDARLACGNPPLGIRRLLDVWIAAAAGHLHVGAGRACIFFILAATHIRIFERH